MDLDAAERQAPGDGNRPGGKAAVPLSPGFPGAAGAGEVRPLDPFRREAARPAGGHGRTHGAELARSRPRPAVAVRLVNLGWFRVGSEEYARRHKTFGIPTLQKTHVKIRGSRITFSYPGKRRIRVRTALIDPELAGAVRELQQLPGGRRLFRYRLEGELYNLTARRLNEYIQEHMHPDFTAKDFRTWGGTLLAAIALAEHGVSETEAERKRTIAAVMRTVGEKLGNTPTVARASYVSPAVVEQFAGGRTLDEFRPRHLRVVGARDMMLDPEERALLSLLRSWRVRRRQAEDAEAA